MGRYFQEQLSFVQSLVDIAERLRFVEPVSARGDHLKRELRKMDGDGEEENEGDGHYDDEDEEEDDDEEEEEDDNEEEGEDEEQKDDSGDSGDGGSGGGCVDDAGEHGQVDGVGSEVLATPTSLSLPSAPPPTAAAADAAAGLTLPPASCTPPSVRNPGDGEGSAVVGPSPSPSLPRVTGRKLPRRKRGADHRERRPRPRSRRRARTRGYLPVCRASDPICPIVRIPPDEGHVFKTKQRAPTLITCEVIVPDVDLEEDDATDGGHGGVYGADDDDDDATDDGYACYRSPSEKSSSLPSLLGASLALLSTAPISDISDKIPGSLEDGPHDPVCGRRGMDVDDGERYPGRKIPGEIPGVKTDNGEPRADGDVCIADATFEAAGGDLRLSATSTTSGRLSGGSVRRGCEEEAGVGEMASTEVCMGCHRFPRNQAER